MTQSDKTKLIKQNSTYRLTAIVMPLIFHSGLANTQFSWPILLPILLLTPMLGSNNLLSKAAGGTSDDSRPK
jgi:hypothetical protein